MTACTPLLCLGWPHKLQMSALLTNMERPWQCTLKLRWQQKWRFIAMTAKLMWKTLGVKTTQNEACMMSANCLNLPTTDKTGCSKIAENMWRKYCNSGFVTIHGINQGSTTLYMQICKHSSQVEAHTWEMFIHDSAHDIVVSVPDPKPATEWITFSIRRSAALKVMYAPD